MKALVWLVIAGCVVGIAVALWAIARREARRRAESEARSAALLSEAMRAKAKAPQPGARD
ncbi:MAG: hypothetical protein AB1452_02840 [Pseudomonadota bacterium]